MNKLSEEQFLQIVHYMYTYCGIDLHDKRFLVESKILVACFRLHLKSCAEFFDLLHGPQRLDMEHLLVDLLTTNHTYFYREEAHFKLVEELISAGELPVQKKSLSCFCAGCSTGQEPYTLAMCLEQCSALGLLKVPYHIMATDVSEHAVQQAQRGHYKLADYVRLPKLWQQSYCYLLPGGFEVKQALRQKVTFKLGNLLDLGSAFSNFDLIFCRNVLIYFDLNSRQKVAQNLQAALLNDGYLFIGHTEMLPVQQGLSYQGPSVYKKAGGGHAV